MKCLEFRRTEWVVLNQGTVAGWGKKEGRASISERQRHETENRLQLATQDLTLAHVGKGKPGF